MQGPASNNQPVAPDALQQALISRVQTALLLLGITLVIAIVYLVGWSIQLLVLSVLTPGVGLITVLIDRRRRRLVPSGVDQVEQLEAPAEKARTELRTLAQRTRFLVVVLLSALVNLAFIAMWAFLSLLFSRALDLLGLFERPSDARLLRYVELAFNVLTLLPLLAYLIWDSIHLVRRVWAYPKASPDQ
jgi:Na+-transporting methylmalonyl-CoA/oxaloacetate decarboxylase gamma subunit